MKNYCSGCRNNFYNGNNNLGVISCWSRKSAEVVWRIPVGMWECPPFKGKKKERVFNCWHGEGSNRIIYVKPEAITSDGFWR